MSGQRVLYLSYDGMTDPLGQSQVLPYLVGLSQRGHRITLVSWEKPERAEYCGTIGEICAGAGIDWHPQVYHSSPKLLSTLLDMRRAWPMIDRMDRDEPFDLVHLRSYIAADPALKLKARGRKFLFDMRGFWVDERIDRGIWPQDKFLYRLAVKKARGVEKRLFSAADGLVSLTHAAICEIDRRGFNRPSDAMTMVVPCCADLDLFKPRTRQQRITARDALGIPADAPMLVYLGSIGGAYRSADMFEYFRAWSADKPDAKFLFLTLHSAEEIRALPGAEGLGDRLIVRAASRQEVPIYAGAADLGISFIEVSRSGIASSPVKMGELMALGVPVVANGGVGDVAEILSEGGGVLVDDLDRADLGDAARRADVLLASAEGKPRTVRKIAERWYDLEDGIARYADLYDRLGERG